MDDVSPAAPIPVDPIDPAESLEGVRDYWESYQRMISQHKSDYQKEVKDAERQGRIGTLAKSQVSSRISAAKDKYDTSINTLKTGPTYEILQGEFEFQRNAVINSGAPGAKEPEYVFQEATFTGTRKDGDRQQTNPAGWYLATGGGKNGENPPTLTFVGVDKPEPNQATKIDFGFDEPESFFSSKFGLAEFDPQTATPDSSSRAKRSRVSPNSEGIGVGQVYSWY